jgi:hypothetical protein
MSSPNHSEQIVAIEGQKENRAGNPTCAVWHLLGGLSTAVRGSGKPGEQISEPIKSGNGGFPPL